MKGSPLRELMLVLAVAVLCIFPLHWLTRSPLHRHGHSHSQMKLPQAGEGEAAWLEIRASHPPESLQIFQEGVLLWEGAGDLNLEAEFELRISENRSRLDLVFRWPEEVEQAWTALSLEAGDRPLRSTGFWSAGEDRRSWHVEWEAGL